MFRPTLCVRLCFDHTLYSTFCSFMFRPHIALEFCSFMFRPPIALDVLFDDVSTTHCTRLFVRLCFDHTLHSTFCSFMFRPPIALDVLFDDVSTTHCTGLFVRLCFDQKSVFDFVLTTQCNQLTVSFYVSTTHYTRLFVRRCFDHTLYSTFCSTMFRPYIALDFLFD